MQLETKFLNEFFIAGIWVRTTNANNQSQKNIGELWQRFFSEKISNKINDKESKNIYCVYTDYESDFTGAYTCILGCKVSSLQKNNGEFVCKKIPASSYQVYTSVGKLPDCVIQTWKEIWNSTINRSYLADFDVYNETLQNAEHAEVQTFISIKE
ncbi:MAG: GyrI-like domain-containing protein [Chitinophagaceae bacterium]